MIWAIFKIMALRLWRDKGALALAFILPGFIYAVFAAIFSTASGGKLDMRVALAVTDAAPATVRLSDALQSQTDFSVTFDSAFDREAIDERVRLGTEDVGLILSDDIAKPGAQSVIIIYEPSRKIAADMLSGQVRQIIGRDLPDVVLAKQINLVTTLAGGLTPAQSGAINAALESEALTDATDFISVQPARRDVDVPEGDATTAYYVGATAIMFLLFSAMQGAALSLEERGSGITDRLLLGPRGAMAMMAGKFSFLSLQGTVQALIIVAVAAIFFKISVTGHLPALLFICVLAASVAAAIALLVSVIAKSSVQMNTASTFIVLLFSALGGSMVPRFMMPGWMQSAGSFTPNAWVIDLFYGLLARGSDASQLALPALILALITAGCLALAALLSHRLMRF